MAERKKIGFAPSIDFKKFNSKREVEGSLTRALMTSAKQNREIVDLQKRLKLAIGGLRSIAYGDASTWPNCSSREVAKQALKDSGGEKYGLTTESDILT